MAVLTSRKRLVLPARKLIGLGGSYDPTTPGNLGDYGISCGAFDSEAWEGVPTANRWQTTPIITHRGGYLANEFALDPEGATTSPVTKTFGGKTINYPFQQYGIAPGGKGLIRPPSMLIFDVNLAQSADTNPPSSATGANQTTHLETIWTNIVTANESLLEQYNVFVGSSYSMAANGWPYIRGWLPSISETQSHYDPNPYDETKRNFDASYFLGGNLLHLTTVYINFINNGTASQYVERDQVADPKTVYDPIIDDDVAAVVALGPRFNRYRKVVFYRWYRQDADRVTVSDDLYDTHSAYHASLADYFEFQGPFDARDNIGVTEDTSLYSLATTAIQDFFSW